MYSQEKFLHGGDIVSVRQQYSGKELIDFSANINPLGLPKQVQIAYQSSMQDCTVYPDPYCRELRSALGAYEAVPEDWIICGNGAADLIYRIVFAVRPRKALLLAPTFAEYEQALLQVGCDIVYHNLFAENVFMLDSEILKQIPGCSLLFICNPNNPTGQLCEPSLLHCIAEECRKSGCILVVDECFLEFLDDCEKYTLIGDLQGNDHLVVLRAFTKLFAMPGLRLGYALSSNSSLLNQIEKTGAPWSVSVPAQACGTAAVREKAYLEQSRNLITEERSYLQQQLIRLGITVYSGHANYLLFYVPNAALYQKMINYGIIIRDCSNYRGLGSGYYRIAVRTRQENNKLLQAIKELL